MRLLLISVLSAAVIGAPAASGDSVPSPARVTVIGDSIASAVQYDPGARAILAKGVDLDLQVAVCRRLVGVSCPYQGVNAPTLVDLLPTLRLGGTVVVAVGYNDYPGVRVIETNGSTTVAESPSQFGVSESGYPVTDSYQLTLTQAPTAGVVTITVTGQSTRTSQTGGIVAFSKQVIVCVLGPSTCTAYGDFSSQKLVNFTGLNWDLPVTVVVRAIGNNRVDGMDTHVFAQTLDQLNTIQARCS